MPSESTQYPPGIVPAASKTGTAVKSALSKRVRLRQAAFIAEFSVSTLKKMSESLSFSPETAREDCQAAAAMGRLWSDAVEVIRFGKGEPAPGSLRHSEAKAKKPKSRLGAVPRPPKLVQPANLPPGPPSPESTPPVVEKPTD